MLPLVILGQAHCRLKCSSFSSNQASLALQAPWAPEATAATKAMLVPLGLLVPPVRMVCVASLVFPA